jgi:serine/threonine protein kinase
MKQRTMSTVIQLEEKVFYAALELSDPAQRRAFLDEICTGNPGLRGRVEELLASQGEADRFFDEGLPAVNARADISRSCAEALSAAGDSTLKFAPEEQPGTYIAHYKLLEKIGEGGFGIVYMAEQEQPVRRRVALKIIKLGMDTKSVIARFEAERQALAIMDHPNIARVFEAGATATGRPYFVMELVRGIKITDYCDQNHFDTHQRLDLFIQVCHAIQHAHQKGIIHRDIKPSNILVTFQDGAPVPKVIDFGIAKATETRLTEKTLFTAYAQIIGTPAYMSPEQAEMSTLDIDTRSDIYSLGVLLYELLTGKTPFDPKELVQSGLDEMRRTLREREPERPSNKLHTLQRAELSTTAQFRQAEPPSLISMLRGDLDWIVMKALEKDRRRRYATANGLAVDIQRYLNDEPVTARPPSRLYRFQKLVRRNQVVFAAITTVALILVIGLAVSTWLFLKEREARRRAVAAELQQARLRAEAEEARANEAELRQQAEVREKIAQAAYLISQERYGDADELLDKLSLNRPTLDGAAVFRAMGEWHALQSHWKQAAARFTVLLQINRLDACDVATLDHLECGSVLSELGDSSGYENFRNAAIARYAGTTCPVADRIVKISLLSPVDQQVIASLQPLTELTAKSFTEADTSGDIFQAAWRSLSLALFEYRCGRYDEAAKWSRRCLAYAEPNPPRTATARIILAMSCQALGHTEEARAELTQAREAIDGKFKTELDRGSPSQGFWFDWVFGRILLREASRSIPEAAQNIPPATRQ